MRRSRLCAALTHCGLLAFATSAAAECAWPDADGRWRLIVVWHEDLLDYLYPETPPQLPTIHGTANVTLEPLTAGPYTLAAETESFTLTGGAASMRVSGA